MADTPKHNGMFNGIVRHPAFLPVVIILEILALAGIRVSQEGGSFVDVAIELAQLPFVIFFSELAFPDLTGLQQLHIFLFCIFTVNWVLQFILGDIVNLAVEYPFLFLGLIVIEVPILSAIDALVNGLGFVDVLLEFATLPFSLSPDTPYSSLSIMEQAHVFTFLLMCLIWILGLSYSLVKLLRG